MFEIAREEKRQPFGIDPPHHRPETDQRLDKLEPNPVPLRRRTWGLTFAPCALMSTA